MNGTPAIAVATVSNGTPSSLSVVAAAGGLARQRQLALDRAGLVVREALLALLQRVDRALRVAGKAQRLGVLEQRVGARDLGRALAQFHRLLRVRQRLLRLAGVVEVVRLELERCRVVARDLRLLLLRLLRRLLLG